LKGTRELIVNSTVSFSNVLNTEYTLGVPGSNEAGIA
jgi:hypothetical protein